MTKRQMALLACTAAVVASGLGAAPSAGSWRVHRVHPGESIQKAVDAAKPGDTVLLSPGLYHESVTIKTSDLTLRGLNADSAVIVPDAASTSACGKAGNGICVTGTDGSRVERVTVRSL